MQRWDTNLTNSKDYQMDQRKDLDKSSLRDKSLIHCGYLVEGSRVG